MVPHFLEVDRVYGSIGAFLAPQPPRRLLEQWERLSLKPNVEYEGWTYTGIRTNPFENHGGIRRKGGVITMVRRQIKKLGCVVRKIMSAYVTNVTHGIVINYA